MEIREIINGEVFFDVLDVLPTYEDDFPHTLNEDTIAILETTVVESL